MAAQAIGYEASGGLVPFHSKRCLTGVAKWSRTGGATAGVGVGARHPSYSAAHAIINIGWLPRKRALDLDTKRKGIR